MTEIHTYMLLAATVTMPAIMTKVVLAGLAGWAIGQPTSRISMSSFHEMVEKQIVIISCAITMTWLMIMMQGQFILWNVNVASILVSCSAFSAGRSLVVIRDRLELKPEFMLSALTCIARPVLIACLSMYFALISKHTLSFKVSLAVVCNTILLWTVRTINAEQKNVQSSQQAGGRQMDENSESGVMPDDAGRGNLTTESVIFTQPHGCSTGLTV